MPYILGVFPSSMFAKANAIPYFYVICSSTITFASMFLTGKQRNKKIWKKLMSVTSSTSTELRDGNLKYPFINFKEIVLATNNFSNSNMLGHGGFGNVYKVTWNFLL